MNTTQFTSKPVTKSRTNSLIEICKLFFAFVVLKVHGLTPIDKDLPWLTTAGITVEFFFVVMGWFLIKGIIRHQEKNQQLGLWRSWWSFFKKKIGAYVVPCIIPGIVTNILALFYDGQIPNGLLWMYWFIHDAFVVMFIYYIIFFKTKNEKTRWITIACIFAVSYTLKFVLSNYFENLVILYDFPRALSCISFGMICSKIPVPKSNNKTKVLAWLMFLIVCAAEVALVVLPAQMVFGTSRTIFKDVCNIVLFPLLIWSCLWVDFSWGPLNYIGKWSKGIYMWQMVPYSIMVIGNYYNIPMMSNGYLLMFITIGLTIAEDPVRKLVKHIKNKKMQNPEYVQAQAVRKQKYINVYWRKSTHIVLLSIALACFAAGAAMGLFGLIDGMKHGNMSMWFMTGKRNSFYCDGIVLLIASTLIIGIFPFNYFMTTRAERKQGIKYEK